MHSPRSLNSSARLVVVCPPLARSLHFFSAFSMLRRARDFKTSKNLFSVRAINFCESVQLVNCDFCRITRSLLSVSSEPPPNSLLIKKRRKAFLSRCRPALATSNFSRSTVPSSSCSPKSLDNFVLPSSGGERVLLLAPSSATRSLCFI